jgi:hypothetical protein
MPVPLIDLTRDKAQLAEVEAAVVRVVRSGQYILGPEVENLERELQDLSRLQARLTMSSGTDALLAPLMALGIGPGDEVVLPTYSFFATAGVVARVGARRCSSTSNRPWLNHRPAAARGGVARVQAAEGGDGGAPVRLAFDVDAVLSICRKFSVPLIEDAAQAIGTKVQGPHGRRRRAVRRLVDVPDQEHGRHRRRRLPDHQRRPVRGHLQAAAQPRPGRALQAPPDRRQLPHGRDPGRRAARQAARHGEGHRAAARERGALPPLFAEAKLLEWCKLPTDTDRHAYHQFVLRVPKRSATGDRAPAPAGHRLRGLLPDPVPPPAVLRQYLGAARRLPGRRRKPPRTALALPIFQGLTEGEQIDVVGALAKFVR